MKPHPSRKKFLTKDGRWVLTGSSPYRLFWPLLELMPPLSHWPDRSRPFSNEQSEVLAFIRQQCRVETPVALRIFDSAYRRKSILFSQESKLWSGARYLAQRSPSLSPVPIVNNLLHRGGHLAVIAQEASNILLDLCISVASGSPWIGFPTLKVPVLYMNLVAQEFVVRQRMIAIAKAKGVTDLSGCSLWNLCGNGDNITPEIFSGLRGQYGLIVLDPIYKITWCHACIVDEIVRHSGASLAIGDELCLPVPDRDLDTLVSIAPHGDTGAYLLDSTTRVFGATDPILIRWKGPVLNRVFLNE